MRPSLLKLPYDRAHTASHEKRLFVVFACVFRLGGTTLRSDCP